jgi:hypothetical protein
VANEIFARDSESVAGSKTRQAEATRVKESRASAGPGWNSPRDAKQSE